MTEMIFGRKQEFWEGHTPFSPPPVSTIHGV